MSKIRNYLNLYLSFFKIGLITFGGGLALVSVFFDEFVERKKWLKENEFTDIVAISESTPGPIAINAATFIGTKQEGILGGIIATLGVITPSIIIITLISIFYDKFITLTIISKAFKGISGAVVVLIGSALFKLSKTIKDSGLLIVNIILMILTIVLRIFFSLNTIFIIIGGGIIGYILYSYILSNKEVIK